MCLGRRKRLATEKAKPSLVGHVSCARVPGVDLSCAPRFFSGYSGFPPSLKSIHIEHIVVHFIHTAIGLSMLKNSQS